MNVWEIHPALVHFPIALLLSAVAVDVFAWWRRRDALNRVATGLLIAGVATCWVAANFGLLAFFTVPAHTDEAHTLMLWHMGAAVSSLVLFTGLAVARWMRRAEPVKGLEHFVGLVAAAFLTITGALGGYIVYHGGAGVEPKLLAAELRKGHKHGGQTDKATGGKPMANGQSQGMEGMEHGADDQAAKSPMQKSNMPGMQHRAGGKHGSAAKGEQATGESSQQNKEGESAEAQDEAPSGHQQQSAQHDHGAAAKNQKGQHDQKKQIDQEHPAGHKSSSEPKSNAEKESAGGQSETQGQKHQGHDTKRQNSRPADQKHEPSGQSAKHEQSGPTAAKKELPEAPKQLPKIPRPDARAAEVPAGYRVEVVETDLAYPTSVEFDEAGAMYVAEGGFSYGDDVAPARVLRIDSNGSRQIVADELSAPVTDLLWHDGRLFISHRGKISVLEASGVRDLVTDLPSFGDHHNNQLAAGPDGKIYFGQGTATNSGVVGLDNFKMGWLSKHPKVHDIPAKDIRLRGEERGEQQVQTFHTPDPLAMLADRMQHGDDNEQSPNMAGIEHDLQPSKESGGASQDRPPKSKIGLAKASEFEASVQANRARNQPPMPEMKGMEGMKGMQHGSGPQGQAKNKGQSMPGMQHGSNGQSNGKGMDGGMSAMQQQMAMTSAFQPFGKTAPKDGAVRGETKANGTILRMDPDGSNLEVFAWGLRNPFGVMWGPDKKLYASDNGYDERGSRPIAHAPDLLWHVRRDGWYGFPDYAGDVPVTDSQFKPQTGPAPEFLMRDHPPIERPLATLKPHAGAAKLDFSRNRAFGFEGQMFLALVGDMNPITGQHSDRSGFEVIRIDPQTGETQTFFRAKANALGPKGMEYVATAGPKRPVDVRFSRDGESLYVVDFGAIAVIKTAIGPAPRPFPNTGAIWRISPNTTRTAAASAK